MTSKKKPKIVEVSITDKVNLIKMGNKIREGFASMKYFANDFFYYHEFEESVLEKKVK